MSSSIEETGRPDFELGELEVTPAAPSSTSLADLGARAIGRTEPDGFKIVLPVGVLRRIVQFSSSDLSHEVGGFLAGRHTLDGPGTRVQIEGFLPAERAVGNAASLRITAESQAEMDRRLRRELPGARVVGWHHTHPGYSVFLSSTDVTTHRSFFNLPWMVALVVDPCRHTMGFFRWRDGRIVPCGFYLATRTGPLYGGSTTGPHG